MMEEPSHSKRESWEEANQRLTKTNLFVNRTMTFMMPLMMLIMNGTFLIQFYIAEVQHHIYRDLCNVQEIESPRKEKDPVFVRVVHIADKFVGNTENISDPDEHLKVKALSFCCS